MELNWRSQRQIIIFATYFLIVFLPVAIIVYSLLHHTNSCFNGIQDGDEEGIDCNGSCQLRCDGTYRDLKVDFARGLKVSDGVYDIFALVENFNTNVNFPNVPYTLNFYSDQGALLGTASGTLSLYPQTRAAIYLPSLQLVQPPKTVDLTLLPHKALALYNTKDIPQGITVENWQSQRGANESLQVVGEIQNPNNYEAKNVKVYAMLYDDTKTVYAVSKTQVYSILGRQKSGVSFTWGNIPSPTNVDFVVVFDQ